MIVIITTFDRINPLVSRQHIRTRLKGMKGAAQNVTLNSSNSFQSIKFDTATDQSSMYPHSYTNFPLIDEDPSKNKDLQENETTQANKVQPLEFEPIQLPFSIAASKAHRHVLPRAAFFDKRKRGEYKNTTVILAHMKKIVIEKKLVVACIVDGQRAKSFKVQIMVLNRWIHENHPECTHDNVLIYCYNTPGRNNSRVALVYANPDNISQHFETESEHPLFIPPTVKTSGSNVMVCTTVYKSPPFFIEWLHYQKTLGVNLVYINAQESFLKSKEFNDTFFQGLLADGFVQLKVWQEYLNTREVFYHSQLLYYQNCLYRFQGVHDYAIMVDTDDFVISRANKTLQQCLSNLFVNNLGSVRLRWMRYYEPRCGLNFTGNLTRYDVGNLTQYVNISSATRERNFKSIHKLSSTVEVKIHEVGELMQGYHWSIAPDWMIYAAHIKKLKLKKDQLKRCDTRTSVTIPVKSTTNQHDQSY